MPKQHLYYVYILTNKGNTVIYVGVTNDLQNRVWQHKREAMMALPKLTVAINWFITKSLNTSKML
ncbi:GIY-YIG nuclease family protein [Mucilaginibacter sp. dw_454]|uniref:GIY-YIG nuclease family protein n=1 Tax=Mucilaginibacter sp. dw_454 TaxID=2720079 RepID=UPI002107A6AA|nr:GIY-YIG nuclease family protein [Mucilaginibacter sp. dw_454]